MRRGFGTHRMDIDHPAHAVAEVRRKAARIHVDRADECWVDGAEDALKVLEVEWVRKPQAIEAHEGLVGRAAAHVELRTQVRGSSARQSCQRSQRIVADVRRELQFGCTETSEGNLRRAHPRVATRRHDDFRDRQCLRRCEGAVRSRRARQEESSARPFHDPDAVGYDELFEDLARGAPGRLAHDSHVRLDEIAAVQDRQAARLQFIERLLEGEIGKSGRERRRRRSEQRQNRSNARRTLHLISIVPSDSTSCRRSVVASMTSSASNGFSR